MGLELQDWQSTWEFQDCKRASELQFKAKLQLQYRDVRSGRIRSDELVFDEAFEIGGARASHMVPISQYVRANLRFHTHSLLLFVRDSIDPTC